MPQIGGTRIAKKNLTEIFHSRLGLGSYHSYPPLGEARLSVFVKMFISNKHPELAVNSTRMTAVSRQLAYSLS